MSENDLKLHQGKFRFDIKKDFFKEKVVKHWNKVPRDVVWSHHPWSHVQDVQIWLLGTGFCGELVSAKLTFGLNNLTGLFQSKQFYDSMASFVLSFGTWDLIDGAHVLQQAGCQQTEGGDPPPPLSTHEMYLGFWVQCWAPQRKRDTNVLEQVQ